MSKYYYPIKGGSPYERRVCPVCGIEAWIRVGGKYCSRRCAGMWQVKHFTGSEQRYKRNHSRLHRKRGSAYKCGNGCVATRYTWANLTGRYSDPSDYIMLCDSCHRRFDRWRVAVIVTHRSIV